MRKKHLIQSDILRRKIFLKFELKRKILNSIEKNILITNSQRYLALYFKSDILRKSSVVQQVNRCFITGRP
jgi:hypothetical protein